MSPKQAASELADSLEAALPLATTRAEHIRVAGHAARARWLAETLSQAPEPASKPTADHAAVFQAPTPA